MRDLLFFSAGVIAMVIFSAVQHFRNNSVEACFARLREEFKLHVGRPVEVFNSEPTGTLFRVISVGDDHALLDDGGSRPIEYQFAHMAGVKARYIVSEGKVIPTVKESDASLMTWLLSRTGS